MIRSFFFVLACFASLPSFSQTYNVDSSLNALKIQKDSTMRALVHADSAKVEKEFAEKIKWEKVKGVAFYPLLKGSENSGVVPISGLTEIPDPNIDYKLLFELTGNNPDSLAKEINFGLAEVARVINLHVASGIPANKIFPVIVVHAGALNAITKNESYKEHYKTDNPNLKLLEQLKNMGCELIACGQAMTFFDVKKEALLPEVKISLTAQTVISSYQLKGFVLFKI